LKLFSRFVLWLTVEPHILENASSKDVIAKEGETVELVCNVTGVPPPTVHWYRRPLGQSRGTKERKYGLYDLNRQ